MDVNRHWTGVCDQTPLFSLVYCVSFRVRMPSLAHNVHQQFTRLLHLKTGIQRNHFQPSIILTLTMISASGRPYFYILGDLQWDMVNACPSAKAYDAVQIETTVRNVSNARVFFQVLPFNVSVRCAMKIFVRRRLHAFNCSLRRPNENWLHMSSSLDYATTPGVTHPLPAGPYDAYSHSVTATERHDERKGRRPEWRSRTKDN